MFTENSLGLLSLQHLYSGGRMYTFNSEVSIPLLEGGLLYRGVFSELSLEGFNEVLLFADNQSLHTVQFVKISPTGYQSWQETPNATA